MAIGFVGKGLGMMAAVVPLGVVTPPAILAATARLLTETGNTITGENGNALRSEQNG
jgi:hypothetical protein